MVTLCDYCNNIAVSTCSLCGKRVCEEHCDSTTGLCTTHKFGMKAKWEEGGKKREREKTKVKIKRQTKMPGKTGKARKA